jgi:hypothetical protein
VPIDLGAAFTIQEHARLLNLRQRVRQAKSGAGRLSDDLAPEVAATPEPEGRPRRDVSLARLLLAAGALVVSAGGVGMLQTNAAMGPNVSAWFARFVPDPIANPARYLGAVNSSSGQATGVDSVNQLAQKQAMNR